MIDDEGMTISNPGGFIDGVNLKNLLTVEPHGRNPALADVMKRIGLAEKTGRGIDRIYEGSIILEDHGQTILSPPVDLLNYLFKEQKQIYRLQNLLRMSKTDRGNRYQYMC